MKHKKLEHPAGYHDNDYSATCMVCELFVCEICGGFEGGLPTDCPGEQMHYDRQQEIYNGLIDFREGRGWVKPDGTGRSMGDFDIKYPPKPKAPSGDAPVPKT